MPVARHDDDEDDGLCLKINLVSYLAHVGVVG